MRFTFAEVKALHKIVGATVSDYPGPIYSAFEKLDAALNRHATKSKKLEQLRKNAAETAAQIAALESELA